MDSLYHTDPTAAVEALGRLPHLALEYLGGSHLGWEVVEKDSPDRLAVLRTDTRRGAAPHAPPRLRILAVAGEHAREAMQRVFIATHTAKADQVHSSPLHSFTSPPRSVPSST